MPVNTLTTEPRPKRAKIDYQTAVVFRSQGLTVKEVAQKMGINEGSLRVGLANKGISKLLADTRQKKLDIATEVLNEVNTSSSKVRKALAVELEQQAEALSRQPVIAYNELPNKDGIQGRANTVKALAETAAKVYGWDQAGTGGDTPILMLLMDQGEAIQALEVESSVSQTPIDGVPVQPVLEQTPQDTEPTQG